MKGQIIESTVVSDLGTSKEERLFIPDLGLLVWKEKEIPYIERIKNEDAKALVVLREVELPRPFTNTVQGFAENQRWLTQQLEGFEESQRWPAQQLDTI